MNFYDIRSSKRVCGCMWKIGVFSRKHASSLSGNTISRFWRWERGQVPHWHRLTFRTGWFWGYSCCMWVCVENGVFSKYSKTFPDLYDLEIIISRFWRWERGPVPMWHGLTFRTGCFRGYSRCMWVYVGVRGCTWILLPPPMGNGPNSITNSCELATNNTGTAESLIHFWNMRAVLYITGYLVTG